MKREYTTPVIMVEEFAVNHTIADCGDTEMNLNDYECLTGPQKDNGTAFSDNCSRPCKVFAGYSQAQKLGGKSASFSGVDGLIAYCVKGQNVANATYAGTSEWYTEDGKVMHKNSHPMRENYHCMVRGYTNSEVGNKIS